MEDTPLSDVAGVLSLELCGDGDTMALWDAGEATPFLGAGDGGARVRRARAGSGYHVIGRIPVFGSDHRAFAAAGIPAYGFTMVPAPTRTRCAASC